jgi:hypothetical protein
VITRIHHAEPTLDTLEVNTLAGDDDVFVDPLARNLIGVLVDLGTDE